MEFKFDSNQHFQLEAIRSVVQLFDGQPQDADSIVTTLRGTLEIENDNEPMLDLDLSFEVGAIGNNLILEDASIQQNVQHIQDKNGLEVTQLFSDWSRDFDIEMETGTGKTYVYLRTVFELAEKYNFKKFIILVPSVAIREGVSTSIRLMRQHFRELYPGQPFDYSVYSGSSAEEVQAFATSTNVQILVMTIDSIRGDKNSRVIHQTRDKLNGLRPIDYLKATHPIVIMDEPQNMESVLSQTSIKELDPLATLRYSATHRKLRNVLYRLDPVDAHDLGLVKQIVVAEVLQQGTDAKPYIRLLDVSRDPWVAKIELLCRKADGSIEKQVKKVKQGQDLAVVSGNSAYENNWRINEISLDPPSVELTNHGLLNVGEEIGGNSDSIYREMIRETIREHLRKEELLQSQNIKVLSLFFIDKVANFLGEGTNNHDADGPFVKWFDELLVEERAKSDSWKALLPQDPHELRSAYFSQIKRGKTITYQDSSGETKADDDAYDLIMRDKERLLDQSEPVRFIFSHSALREGWDNPNVFQICTLREMGKETERRQTIGRGLRLPVNQAGVRIADRGICQLTVIANESYSEFAKHLQSDYVKAGVEIGKIRVQEFSKIVLYGDDQNFGEDDRFGFERSQEIYNHLTSHGFIKEGVTTPKYRPNELGFTLELPGFYAPYEAEILDIIGRVGMDRYVKPAIKRQARRLNKQLFDDPIFEEFWHAISRRTTYRVSVDRAKLVEETVKAIKAAPEIDSLSIHVTKAGVKIVRGGTKASETSSRIAELRGTYELPDIIAELQESTSLTRRTIVEILCKSERLQEFINNPNDFIQMVKVRINNVMASLVIDGIQYEQISGSVYELRELQKDGLEEKDRFIDQLYEVQNRQKSDFDYLVLDSAPEREFAKLLDSREDVRLFMKLPAKFKIPTPVGDYNPDWAILKQVDGQDRIYMIRETKSTLDEMKRRPLENAKIESAKKHFEAIGISDYKVSAPGSWHL